MPATIQTLRTSAVRRVTLAAMITSAFLAPLILGTFCRGIDSMVASDEGSGPSAITVELLTGAVLAMIPAACLGGFAMYRGATKRSEAHTLGWATVGGVLFLGAALGCVVLASRVFTGTATHTDSDSPAMLIWPLIMMILGSIVSAPFGAAFGVLFLVAQNRVTLRLEHPSADTPASAMRNSAAMLLLASGVAGLCAIAVRIPVAVFLRSHLDLDAPWFAILLPAPLALSAVLFVLLGIQQTRSLHRTRQTILSGTHPEYYPGDIAPEEDAVPLTEADRRSANKRTLMRRESSAYRGGEGDAVRVYVGADSTAPSIPVGVRLRSLFEGA
jgi:hypothetical protein